MKKQHCPVCDNNFLIDFLNLDDYKLHKCSNCQIIFTNPFPDEKELSLLNKQLYGTEKARQGYFQRLPELEKRAKKITKEILQFKRRGKLLDIGCGYGLILKAAKEAGFEVSGIEKQQELHRLLKKQFGPRIYIGQIEDLDLPKDYYDVVCLFDVLEHLREPLNVLQKIKSIMRLKAILVIQTPNINSVMYYLNRQKWNWLLVPNHLYHFTSFSLKYLLNTTNYSILKEKTFDDISEFNFNLLDKWDIKKEKLLEKLLWKSIRSLKLSLQLPSFLWSRLGYGGLIRIYAKKV